MQILKDLARKNPSFTAQLAAVIEGRKPVVRVEFHLEGEDYAHFVELLVRYRLVWFEHSPFPISICYPTALHEELKKHVKIYESWINNCERDYPFLRLMTDRDDYDSFWGSFSKGELLPLLLSGGVMGSLFETIIARDFEGLRKFLTQYAIARKQKENFDKILGRAFGYPECCSDRWAQDREQKQPKEDYIFYESIVEKGLEDAVPMELRAVGHVTCDILCKPSVDLGRDYLDALSNFDPRLYKIVLEELKKPTLFIDRWSHFTINRVEYAPIQNSLRVKKEDFLMKVNKEMNTTPTEVLLAKIETTLHIGLWWIAVDSGNTVLLCNAKTGEIRVYKKNEKTSIADLRIYRYKS